MKFVAISGSLRKASANTGMLRHCKQILEKQQIALNIVPSEVLGGLPLFNEDIENSEEAQKSVSAMTSQIKDADAIIFATCEYVNRIMQGLCIGISLCSIAAMIPLSCCITKP